MWFGLLLPGLSAARAADNEVRDFDIQVDGKHAGDYHMTIRNLGGGTVTLAAQSDVKVTVLLVPVYTYSYQGLEVWKDGRLQHFESTGKENGKSFGIVANPGGSGMRIQANGRVYTTRPDVWTTSCWQLPDARWTRCRRHGIAPCHCRQISHGRRIPREQGRQDGREGQEGTDAARHREGPGQTVHHRRR